MEAMAEDAAPLREVHSEVPAHLDFEGFVRAETAGLLRIAYLLTGSPSAAEDIVQETLTRLYPRWSRVCTARRPTAYVRRCLVNAYLNSTRSAASRELVVNDVGDRADRADRADVAQTIADRDLLWRVMRDLPQRQRVALVLRYFNDLSDRDVARALGCRAGTVRSLISRGLATLRLDSQLGGRDA
jgi:RNA polymerase sigma-70 factor (sigma-E family)